VTAPRSIPGAGDERDAWKHCRCFTCTAVRERRQAIAGDGTPERPDTFTADQARRRRAWLALGHFMLAMARFGLALTRRRRR